MSENALSTAALILAIVPFAVHGVEVMFPLLSRWIVNGVLPFFGFTLPSRATSLTADEQIAMLDAAIDVAPQEKKTAAKDYIFLMLFEQRQGAICFAAVAAGAVYGLTLPLPERDPLYFVYGVIAVLMMLANAKPRRDPVLGQPPQTVTTRKARGHCLRPILGIGGCAELVGIRERLADEIPSTLQTIVEFLNEQMRSSEVIAVEVKRHEGEGMSTLVSRVIGQTATARQTRQAGPRRQWDEGSISGREHWAEALWAHRPLAFRLIVPRVRRFAIVAASFRRCLAAPGGAHGNLWLPCNAESVAESRPSRQRWTASCASTAPSTCTTDV